MNITIVEAPLVKSETYAAQVDFTGATFKAALLRGGFSFSTGNHKYMKNISTDTGGQIPCIVDALSLTLTRQTLNFITDGFVPGNLVWTDHAGCIGPYRISSVSALVMRLTLLDGATLEDSPDTGDPDYTPIPEDIEIYSNDEVPTINFNAVVTIDAAEQKLTLSGADSGKAWWEDFGMVTGYSFVTDETPDNSGPYVVTSIVGDDMYVTAADVGTALVDMVSSELLFTNSYTPASQDVTFTVTERDLTLDSFDISNFEPALFGSQGAIVYDTAPADDIVIAHIRFQPWTLVF